MSRSSRSSKATLKTRCARTAVLCVGLYVLACAGCASFQRRLIYFPPVFSAEETRRLGTQEGLVRWTNRNGQPIGWKRLAPTQPSEGKVLITHGNAGTAFQCGHYVDVIQQAAALDVFIVEYPGYADRPGKPSERTLYESSDEAFTLLDTNAPIYLVGESLGTGVAAYLAGCYPGKVAGMALLAPYNCLADVAQAHFPIFPVRWVLTDRFPAEDYLIKYRGPIAILTAGGDTVVPEKFGRRLYDGYLGPKRLWEFPQGDHGTVMVQPAAIWQQVIAFWRMNETGKSAPKPSHLSNFASLR